jgi:hypothetical protein
VAAVTDQTAAPAASQTPPEFTYDSGLSEREKLHEPAGAEPKPDAPGGRPA